MIKFVNDENFSEEVEMSDRPVLVYYWASWCGPCKLFGPVINQVADSLENIDVAKVNIDESTKCSVGRGVVGIPTVALFKNGEEVLSLTGARPKSVILNAISEAIA